MKNKLLIILFFSVIMCFVIYSIFTKHTYYYLALGEIPKDQYRYEYQDYVRDHLTKEHNLFKFNKNFLREDYTTTSFLNLINNAATSVNNGEIETITKAINNSSLITLSLGNNELENIITKNLNELDSKKIYSKIDEIIENYEEILRKIRFLTDSPIILLGYINTFNDNNLNEKITNIYLYAESRLSELLYFEDTYLINLTEIFNQNSSYLEKLERLSPSIKGYKYISERIIDIYTKEKLY